MVGILYAFLFFQTIQGAKAIPSINSHDLKESLLAQWIEWQNNTKKAFDEQKLKNFSIPLGFPISVEKIDVLKSINFPFSNSNSWEENFKVLTALIEYYATHGHCCVPQSDKNIGQFVNNIRQFMKQGKLTDEQIERLNSIGFQWTIKPARDKAWDEKFEKLV